MDYELKRSNKLDGILLINKEKDYTSHDVVAIVKKALGEKVGHTGTLDPNATGILPLLIGNGTKLSKYLINHDKVYTATLKLGIKTDTADSTGNVMQEEEVEKFDNSYIEKVLQSFVGKQEQVPPMYSAIKVNGKKLYEYAKKNQEVTVEPRQIKIYSMKLDKYIREKNEIVFTVNCSKGTYIRTLCEDIAQMLKTIGHMKELNRLKVGEFCIQDAVTIEELKQNSKSAQWLEEHIITIEELLKNNPKIKLDSSRLRLFLNGGKLNVSNKDGLYLIYNSDKFIGTGVVLNNQLKRDVIINIDHL